MDAHGIVERLICDDSEQQELPLPDPSAGSSDDDSTRKLVLNAVRKYVASRDEGKPIGDYEIEHHGIMYSDYYTGCGTAFTKFEAAYTGVGENAYEALDDALDMAAQDDWDVSNIKNEFDPNDPVNVQNVVRQNNPDMDEDDAADGVYYYICLKVRGIEREDEDE